MNILNYASTPCKFIVFMIRFDNIDIVAFFYMFHELLSYFREIVLNLR